MICLPTLHAVLLLCLIIGTTTWYNYLYGNKSQDKEIIYKYIYNDFKPQNAINNDLKPQIKENIQNAINNDLKPQIKENIQIIPIANVQNAITNEIHKRDREVLYNDFKPPERRVPEYQYPVDYITTQINFPSRGYPEEYHLLGVALRNNTETVYNLYGRQKYPGANIYEYYVMGSDNKNFNVKIPIRSKGDKEIYNNDIIHIPGTDHSKGEFKVELYNINTPRYIPNL